MPIKTFRGLLSDGQQDRIRLEHRDGKTGYRIKKLDIMSKTPGVALQESVVKVYSIKQTAVDAVVEFSEQTLLAVAYLETHGEPWYTDMRDTIFDRVVFNQDIFITHKDVATGEFCNYYLELETISMDDVEATAVILKNFRNTNTVA
jgi:hypothetical protein